MNFVKEYATSIITVSILAVLLENILPGDGNKKYIRVVIGLLVMLVILQPLTALPHYKEVFALPYTHIDDSALSPPDIKPYIAESFEKKLALRLEEAIYQAFQTAVSCRVTCHVNEDGQITGVSAIHVQPYSKEIGHYIAENYGFEEAIVTP